MAVIPSHSPAEFARQTGEAKSKKYMIFTIAEDWFAIPLFQVKEVIGLTKITALPDMPAFFRGLINLRGRIISIVDLRIKLKIASQKESRKPCIIISELNRTQIGIVVDEVIEVLGVEEKEISREIDISQNSGRPYCAGVARFEGKPLTIILDMEKVLDIETMSALTRNGSSHAA